VDTSGRPALFLDRDGTLVHPRRYPSQPHDLVLYSGIAPLLREARARGFVLVVVTNQAGLARGYFTSQDLAALHAHLERELALVGVRLDAIYHCPHHPNGTIPDLTRTCECRKPMPGLILAAAREHNLNIAASWFIGDRLDDVEAGTRAGCKTILTDLGTEPAPDAPMRTPTFVARDTQHALRIVLEGGQAGPIELDYRPAAWGIATPTA